MTRPRLNMGTLAAIGLAALAVPGVGAGDGAASDPLPNEVFYPKEEVGKDAYRSHDLVGLTVRTSDGEDIGIVSDLVIDLGEDRLDQIVLAHGGFQNLDEDHILVPWSEVRLTTLTTSDEADEKDPGATPVLILTISADVLADTEPFEEDAWRIATGDAMVLVSDLIGHPVTQENGTDIGEFRDILVSNSTVLYAAISTDVDAGSDEGEVLVPWIRLRVDLAHDQIILDADAALFGRVLELPEPDER